MKIYRHNYKKVYFGIPIEFTLELDHLEYLPCLQEPSVYKFLITKAYLKKFSSCSWWWGVALKNRILRQSKLHYFHLKGYKHKICTNAWDLIYLLSIPLIKLKKTHSRNKCKVLDTDSICFNQWKILLKFFLCPFIIEYGEMVKILKSK